MGDLLVTLAVCIIAVPRLYKDVYVNTFFLRTARLWNSLSVECFSSTYDLNGSSLESTNFNLLVLSNQFSLFAFNLNVSFFVVTSCLALVIQLFME